MQITFGTIYQVYGWPNATTQKPNFTNGSGGVVNFYVANDITKPANTGAMVLEYASVPASQSVRLESFPRWVAWTQVSGTSVVQENGILQTPGHQPGNV